MHEEIGVEESEEIFYKPDHRYTHERLAQMVLEQLNEFRDKGKGIRIKHPIQTVANLVYEMGKYNCKPYMAGLISGISDNLVKYYSYQELDVLRMSLENAQFDTIDKRYIEVIDLDQDQY